MASENDFFNEGNNDELNKSKQNDGDSSIEKSAHKKRGEGRTWSLYKTFSSDTDANTFLEQEGCWKNRKMYETIDQVKIE